LLTIPGFISPELRRAAEAHVARARGADRPADAVSESLAAYLDPLARHAYRIVDEHIDALKADGYDEDQIVELTLVGALGSALVGLESTFAGLWGEPQAAQEPKAESQPGTARTV